MAKRRFEDDELSGFVHNLTPIKMSKNNSKYFNCLLQTNTSDYRRVVCFDAVKRALFEKAEQTKSPVKLNDVKQVPSKDSNGTTTDVLVNSNSNIDYINPNRLQFKFYPHEPKSQVQTIEIAEVQTLPERTLVTTSGVVTNIKTPTVMILYGTPTNQQEIIIADQSGYTELVIWSQLVNTVELNKSYKIQNVSTRYFKGRRHLTTTKTSTLTLINDIDHVEIPENPFANITKISGCVTEVRVTKTFMCNSCTKKTVNIDLTTKFARCPSCSMNQLTKSYTNCLSATLNVKDTDGAKVKLTVSDTVLNTYLVIQQREELLNDPSRLEEYLLEKDTITFEYSEDDNVVHTIQN